MEILGFFVPNVVGWFFMGAFLHVLEDSICGGVPLLNPFRICHVFPVLFKTGSTRETVFVCLFVGLSALYIAFGMTSTFS